MIERITRAIEQTAGFTADQQVKAFKSLIVIAVIFLVRRAIVATINRRVEDAKTAYRWRKVTSYITWLILVLAVGGVWLREFGGITTFLGLVSAGLAIALREPVAALAGWLYIEIREPFRIGDRIQLGEFAGDVVDLRLFDFSIMEIGNWVHADQSTGRIIHIPNQMLFTKALINYTEGFQFVWHEIPVTIPFEKNWRKAKEILQELLQKHVAQYTESAGAQIRKASRQFLVFYANIQPTVYTAVVESGVCLTMRYLVDPRQRRSTEEKIWEGMLARFDENPEVSFAYPTRRVISADEGQGSEQGK